MTDPHRLSTIAFLTGPAGAGKTTLAKQLWDEQDRIHGDRLRREAFATFESAGGETTRTSWAMSPMRASLRDAEADDDLSRAIASAFGDALPERPPGRCGPIVVDDVTLIDPLYRRLVLRTLRRGNWIASPENVRTFVLLPPPEVLWKRIEKRGRQWELKRFSLERCHEFHGEFQRAADEQGLEAYEDCESASAAISRFLDRHSSPALGEISL